MDANSIRNIEALLEIRNQATMFFDLFLSRNISNEKVGKLLHEGWCKKKTLAKGVSNQWIDDVYELALASGAYGGKLSGAGGGGFLTMMVPRTRSKKVSQIMSARGLVPYQFRPDVSGSTIYVIE